MPEIHLPQLGFKYSACGSFTEDKERIKIFKEKRNSRYIYQKCQLKLVAQNDMVYRDFKDLLRRTASDQEIKDKVFSIIKNPKYDQYQRGLASVVCKLNLSIVKTK